MDAILWKKDFETGLESVDEQHRHLVDVVNELNALLAKEEIEDSDIEQVYAGLVEYVESHFRDEEFLMFKKGIHSLHFTEHTQVHNSFEEELGFLRSNIYRDNHDHVKYLLDFLTHWLIFHILGIDQSMGRQLESIVSGASADEAYAVEKDSMDSQTKSLLVALNSLFELVSAKNKELVNLNRTLEEKVVLRTEQLAESNHQLEELALTDSLTQLSNRRHGIQQLNILWQEAEKFSRPLVCMVVDVDAFKSVNDTFGHMTGDVVLVEIARTLKENCRTDDIVCRMGGDEFFIVCPNTDLAGGEQLAADINKAVSLLEIPTDSGVWKGSISIGVALKTAEMKNYADFIRAGDDAVYLAKSAGKNCVRTFTGEV